MNMIHIMYYHTHKNTKNCKNFNCFCCPIPHMMPTIQIYLSIYTARASQRISSWVSGKMIVGGFINVSLYETKILFDISCGFNVNGMSVDGCVLLHYVWWSRIFF